MNRQRREDARKKQRDNQRRLARHRRFELSRCNELVMAADTLAADAAEARRLLEKALRVHPRSHDAHERLAELDIRSGRLLEGLQHYEQLSRPPEWPQVTFMAAVAAYKLARFERAHALAQAFLRTAGKARELKPLRAHARRLANSCKALLPHARSSGSGAVALRSQPSGAAIAIPPPAKLPFEGGAAPRRPAVGSHAARVPTFHYPDTPHADLDRRVKQAERVKTNPPSDVQLPAFPAADLPDLSVQFEVDGQPFLSDIDGRIGSVADVLLRRDFAALRMQKGFDELISMGAVQGLEHFWYQLETVRRLLRDFRGRVLLADEVGLGKTIEACLALKEYWMRGLVSKALILTPASLVGQWVDELTTKFGLAVVAAEGGRVAPGHEIWDHQPIVVASLPLVRQRAYRDRLTAIEYDLVIVDEAHVLRNRASAAWQLVNELKKRFVFLLSATPVGNNLSELYNLILLLKPGLLKTEAQFRADFGGLAALQRPERRDRLRALLREVMIRNTRAHIDVKLPRRLAATEVVPPGAAEAELQEQLSSHVRGCYGEGTRTDQWRLMTLQMQAGSSPAALRAALDRYEAGQGLNDLDHLRTILGRIDQPAKTTALIALLRRSDEKTIVFTRFRATLDHLQRALEDAGFRVVTFHGGLSAAEKASAIAAFESEARILVSSEVGGEGRNLQFCRTVVNYDLPWNPVQLEQRVGRVHRIGQARDVFVFNFCLAGSVEQHILKVLHDKLNLFELVAGEIEMILGELDPERDFAEVVMDLWARSSTDGGPEGVFDRFAEELLAAHERYQQTQQLDRALFREEFEV
jgi:superfamily II DNA or RNA helicase